MKKKLLIAALSLLMVVAVSVREARADAFSLTFGGSTLAGDTEDAVTTWSVTGFGDQLFAEIYYFQIGAGPIQVITVEAFRFDTPVSIATFYQVDGLGTCTSQIITGCDLQINHSIAGADWSSSFTRLNNFGGTNYAWYVYADYDLAGTITDQSLVYNGVGRFTQVDGTVMLTWGITGAGLPTDWGMNVCCSSLALGNQLSLLNNDITFTTQAANTNSFSIDRQLALVPEPASMLLFGTGLAGLAMVVRRRSKRA